MADRKVSLLFFIIVILVWAAGLVFYQRLKLQHSEQNLKQFLLKEIESKAKIEDSIRQEIESRKDTNKAISDIEYQRQLKESIEAQLSNFANQQVEYNAQQEEAVGNKFAGYKLELDNYFKNLDEFKVKEEERIGKIEELTAQFMRDYAQKETENSKIFVDLRQYSQESAKQVERLRQMQEELIKQLNDQGRRINTLQDKIDAISIPTETMPATVQPASPAATE